MPAEGIFVAVGYSRSGDNNKIGYSTDGQIWTLAKETNYLFDGNYGLGISYGNGRFVAVGSSGSGDRYKIGYSTDGEVWTLATETNGLFKGYNGSGRGLPMAMADLCP